MVTIAALIVGSMVRVRRSLAVMRAQISVTEDLLRQESEALGGSSRFHVKKMSFSTGRVGGNRWNHRVEVDLKDERRQNVVSLKVEGGYVHWIGVLYRITIRDDGSPYSRSLINKLTQAYDDKKWKYGIVSEEDETDPSCIPL